MEAWRRALDGPVSAFPIERAGPAHIATLKTFEPPLSAMELCWDPDGPGVIERSWFLPDGVVIKGAAPARFGVTIHRLAKDSYRVRVLWNRLCLCWEGLTRVQIMTSSLAIVLSALGTDLWYLLNQPVKETSIAA